MRQLLQDASTGELTIARVPAPKLLAGCVLVRTAASLVSAGTERASAEFASKNLLQKARMRPDLVREVLNKIRRDGFGATISTVRTRLDQPATPGYSSAGTVLAVGEGVTDINPGDRVACAGAGHAMHAEFVCVPRMLVARIPAANITFEEAAFTTVGAVALHGIRTASVQLGDIVAVIGLGLLGQLTVQILKAAGCRVLGMDISMVRAQQAIQSGADAVSHSSADFRDLCLQFSAGHGVDAVLLTAQTSSNDPVELAGAVARNRAVVVAVGDVAMDIPRRTFYEKELDFRVSRSYGPGRYDAAYEQKGIDYPIGYVRWTETRNMEAFLGLAAEGKLKINSLVTHRYPITEAHSAYELITGQSHQPYLGVLISYSEAADDAQHILLHPRSSSAAGEPAICIGLLGAGSFAMGTLLPIIKKTGGVELCVACAASGSHARHAAAKFGFHSCGTDESQVLSDAGINTVVIATRHHLHAAQVIASLNSGKHVFCEKPLCLNDGELEQVVEICEKVGAGRVLMVGFNRRFAPLTVRLKQFLDQVHEPLALHYRVNAGFLAVDHWLNDPQQGGGRIVGEVCHFVDLLHFLARSSVVEVETRSLANAGKYSNDNVLCSLRFANGTLATIHYLANGDKSFSKERIEVFGGGCTAVLEDFRRLELVRSGKRRVFRSMLHQDKGHRAEWEAFLHAIRSGRASPTPLQEIVHTMQTTFALENSRCSGQPVAVPAATTAATTQVGKDFDRAS